MQIVDKSDMPANVQGSAGLLCHTFTHMRGSASVSASPLSGDGRSSGHDIAPVPSPVALEPVIEFGDEGRGESSTAALETNGFSHSDRARSYPEMSLLLLRFGGGVCACPVISEMPDGDLDGAFASSKYDFSAVLSADCCEAPSFAQYCFAQILLCAVQIQVQYRTRSAHACFLSKHNTLTTKH